MPYQTREQLETEQKRVKELEKENKALLNEIQNGCSRCTEDCSLASPLEQNDLIKELRTELLFQEAEIEELKDRITEIKNESKEMLDMLELLYSNVNNDLTDGYFLKNLKD